MYGILLALAINQPTEAQFTFDVVAAKNAEYCILHNGTIFVPGQRYRTPLYEAGEYSFLVFWNDGNKVRTDTVKVTLTPGEHITITIAIPQERVFLCQRPAMPRECNNITSKGETNVPEHHL